MHRSLARIPRPVPEAVRYCGRHFSPAELSATRRIIAVHPDGSRTALSYPVCEHLD